MNFNNCKLLLSLIFLLILSNTSSGQAAGIKYVNSDSVRIVRGYSHAVVFPELGIIKTSGLIGTTKNGSLVTSSARAQIRQTFTNLKNVIEASGSSVESIDEIETFLTDSAYFRDYVQERVDFFKGRKEPPISKTYYIKGLINPMAIVEINVSSRINPASRSADTAVLYVTAILEAKDGEADKLGELLARNILPSKNEKGCLQYDLFRGGKDNNTFILHEQWTNVDAFNLHFTMPYMKDLSKNIKALLKSSTINKMEKIKQ